MRLLTDSRKRISYEHIDDAGASVAGGHEDGAGGLFGDFADHDRFFTAGSAVQCIERGFETFRCDDG